MSTAEIIQPHAARALTDSLTSGTAVPVQRCAVAMKKLGWLLLMMIAGWAATAQAQTYYFVDCTGSNPSDYPTITAALSVAGPNSDIVVTGPCNETVNISDASNLNLGAQFGQTATINGTINITASNTVFLYGLNVTSQTGNAFNIASSHDVTLWTCTGNGNHALGMSAANLSDVTIDGPGSFNNNGTGGIEVNSNAVVEIQTWGGPVEISNNTGPGVWMSDGSLFQTIGLTTIENNTNPPGAFPPKGFGIQALGASKVQIGTCYGANLIQQNQNGGIDVEENSELSLWNCLEPYQSTVTGNGPVGITASFGSQVTLYDNAQISGHSRSGVELYGNSQLHVFSTNLITRNGSAGDPRSAGVLVDGNSEAYIRGGEISHNEGPAILVLVNSSADFTGATFASNAGGIITCDSSSYMASDLAGAANSHHGGIDCQTPHSLGNSQFAAAAHIIPDSTLEKSKAARYKAMSLKANVH